MKGTPTARTGKETPTAQVGQATPTPQPGSGSASQVENVDQQIQDALQSLDQTQQDANNSNASQDNEQQP